MIQGDIMEFNSIDEMVRFIESQSISVNKELAEDMVHIAKKNTKEEQYKYTPETYVRTGKLIECIEGKSTKDSIEIEWRNLGWSNYNKTKKVYAPGALENGTTYGKGGYRPATNFVDETYDELENKIPKKYKNIMKDKGIPIE